MPEVTIASEPFDGADASALRAALHAELVARYGADTEPGAKPGPGDTAAFLVARRAGQAVGCGALRRIDAQTVEIKRMYVAPAARGLGIGARLLAELELRARALGATRVVLETGDAQPEAIALYERAGYRSIPCYGAYDGAPRSRCYARTLADE